MGGVAADTGLMGAMLIAVNLKASLASYLVPLYDEHTVELVHAAACPTPSPRSPEER
jgi:hypothetical protein